MRFLFYSVLLLSLSCTTLRQSAPEREARLNADKLRAAELLEAGEFDKAREMLNALSDEASGDAQVFVMLGDACAGTDAFNDAVTAYEQAIRLAYENHEAHLKLATLLVRHKKTGRALTEFDLAVQYGASDPLTRYNYGLALFEMGQREQAVEQWREARRKAPSDPRYAEAHGIGLAGHDDAGAAEAFFEARRLGADGANFHNNFGLVLQRLDRFAEAETEFAAAVSRGPGVEEYGFNLAALYLRSGQGARAEVAFDKLTGEFGDRWSYRVYRAKALQSIGRDADAIGILDSVATVVDLGKIARDAEFLDRVPPGADEAFEILALAYRGRGDLTTALRLIERAATIDPTNASHLNNYGVILAENGMLARAREQWRKVLEIDAENATARRNLSQHMP